MTLKGIIMLNYPTNEMIEELTLIQEISPQDTMYAGDESHYFRVGASALLELELLLSAAFSRQCS